MLSQTKTCGSEMSVLLVEDIKRIKGEMIMSLLEIMEKRRSIRSYTGESIPKGKLETILAAGLLSASGRKRRPWEFIVVQDKETLLKLSKSRAHVFRCELLVAKCPFITLIRALGFLVERRSLSLSSIGVVAPFLTMIYVTSNVT